MEKMKEGASKAVVKRMKRIGETGAWQTVMPNRLNGTLISMEEIRDNLRLHYGMRRVGLCSHCNRCRDRLTVEHGLRCKRQRESIATALLERDAPEDPPGPPPFTQERMESEIDGDNDTKVEEGNDEVLLLDDAANSFNMLSCLGMLWTMHHCCCKLSRFAFNCYRREVRLVCRRPGKEALSS